MTLYLVFEELEAGRLSLNSRLKVSKYAAGRPPSKIGVRAGKTIKVKDAILALVTKSANDVRQQSVGVEAHGRDRNSSGRQVLDGLSRRIATEIKGTMERAARNAARQKAAG